MRRILHIFLDPNARADDFQILINFFLCACISDKISMKIRLVIFLTWSWQQTGRETEARHTNRPSSLSPLASSLTQYFILNLTLGSSANPFFHRPFPFLPYWFHGLSDHLMILHCSTAGFICMVC